MRLNIEDPELCAWAESRTKDWREGEKRTRDCMKIVHDDWRDGEWRTYRSILNEFGELWPEINGQKATVIVQRYMARLPKRTINGSQYGAPYSLGLHLAALHQARGPQTIVL
jgi:hypothetical protein